MDISEAIRTRRSIRGFRAEPVSDEVLRDILETARLAPSATNCQPWEFLVLTGDALERARQVNTEQFESGAEVRLDIPVLPPNDLPSPYVDRQNALARDLFTSLGIARQDREARMQWQLKGKRFFDAPAAVIVCADEKICNPDHQITLIDMGIVTQTIALLALSYGLGTCIQQDTVFYPQALREALELSPAKRLLVAICIGYPSREMPANNFERTREPLDSMVTWRR